MTFKTVAIEDLNLRLFVRTRLDDDRVVQFAEFLQNGKELDPIRISQDNVVIDGRHRIEAHILADRTKIQANVEHIENEVDLITKAYLANTGGSLPPTQQDTEHTIALLLARRVAKKQIAELLGLPVAIARRYIAQVESKLARTKLMQAVSAVTEDGKTVDAAAQACGVEVGKLKEELSGRQGRRKEVHTTENIQQALTSQFKSSGLRIAKLLRDLLEKHEDGDVTDEEVEDVFAHITSLHKRASRTVEGWRKRHDAKKAKDNSSTTSA